MTVSTVTGVRVERSSTDGNAEYFPAAQVVTGPDGNPIPTIDGLSIPAHDYISLSYTGANLTGVVYKDGGSGGTTVATLTLAYDGSSNLTSVTKS
jgi:hypothetical protein